MYLIEGQFNVWWPNFVRQEVWQMPTKVHIAYCLARFLRIFKIYRNTLRNLPENQHVVSHKKLLFQEHQFCRSSMMTLSSFLAKFRSCGGKISPPFLLCQKNWICGKVCLNDFCLLLHSKLSSWIHIIIKRICQACCLHHLKNMEKIVKQNFGMKNKIGHFFWTTL